MNHLDAVYQPKNYEDRIWQLWLDNDIFSSQVDESKEPYTILMPPPNVTSQLHMGHGLGYSIQDLFIRWKRMQGYNAMWLPGTDHAGIATQMMVEKQLQSEGVTRKELGREAFVEKCKEWKSKYGDLILKQFQKMGFSSDWNRTSYTMDDQLSRAVRYVFVKLFEEKLIYRGERLVNWDPVLQTAVSDDEVENIEVNGHLWTFRYPIVDSPEFIPIATTRPETMLGDTAVAVNPDDERFKHLIGQKVRLPFSGREIPIIADTYVKSEFGTGAVKITPAHDPNDFEIGVRHKLPNITILNDDATINSNAPERFQGMDRFEARKEVIKGLKELDLFDEEKSYKHTVPHSERSKTVIEPKLSQQWFVDMKAMAFEAAEAARNDEIRFHPDSWKKTYLYWLDNIQDWCISRQLWWGHRIPIWYCGDCHETTTGIEDPEDCQACGSKKLTQDEDVLDTWFSSWLWPMSPFGWPEKGQEEIDYYYPTNTMITGPDIIFLWVARMVMVGKKFIGDVPFKDVYFNATVCDKKGRKFSKTLGNGIDPLEVIEKHGADAVRYTAISLAPLGGRVRMSIDDFENGSRFINKLWNATRMILGHLEQDQPLPALADIQLNLSQKWLIERLRQVADQSNSLLEAYRVNEAIEKIYHFVWGSFCDWGIEAAKGSLKKETPEQKKLETLSVLVYCLDGALRLCHPVIPFVTEELWQTLPKHPDWSDSKCLAKAAYPNAQAIPSFEKEADSWQKVQDLISAVRSTRTQTGIPHKERLDVFIKTEEINQTLFESAQEFIESLCKVQLKECGASIPKPAQSLTAIGKGFTAFMPVAGLLDIEKEKVRLTNEEAKLQKVLKGLEGKLNNKKFIENAPADIVTETNEKRDNMLRLIGEIKTNLESLS